MSSHITRMYDVPRVLIVVEDYLVASCACVPIPVIFSLFLVVCLSLSVCNTYKYYIIYSADQL